MFMSMFPMTHDIRFIEELSIYSGRLAMPAPTTIKQP